MADPTGTLSADTPITVEVTGERIEVLNRDGEGEIWVKFGAGTAPAVDSQSPRVLCVPAVAGAARVFRADVPAGQAKTQTVQLVSAGTPAYSVKPL